MERDHGNIKMILIIQMFGILKKVGSIPSLLGLLLRALFLKANNVYAILLKYPSNSKVQLFGTVPTNVTMLGFDGVIQWVQAPAPKNPGIIIDLSGINVINTPSQWAWVFKLENAS